jgi:hypothetical protein
MTPQPEIIKGEHKFDAASEKREGHFPGSFV